ncbi:MAG TPA: fibronectin type III domain-containing protein [Acidimicrobiia bacterium]
MTNAWQRRAALIVVAVGMVGASTGGAIAAGPASAATGSVTPAVAPANDNFAAAQVLPGTASGSVTGSNVDATSEPQEPSNAGNPATSSIWYRYTATATRSVIFRTCGSNFDTVLGVYTGTKVASLKRITSNDDLCGLQSEVMFTATAGVAYSIVVDTATFATGTVALSWGPPPANDMFAKPTILTGGLGSVSGDNFGATSEAGEPVHAGVSNKESVWFRYTPNVSGTLSVDTCGSSFDTVLALYTGSVLKTLTPLVSNDDSCGNQSSVTTAVKSGVAVQIAVASYDKDNFGPYTLHWTLPGAGGIPGRPTVTTVAGGDKWAAIQFSPFPSGGAATSYTVTATPGGATTVVPAGAPVGVITGLNDATLYHFSVVAANASGKSAASAPSSPFTPVAGPITVTTPWSTNGYALIAKAAGIVGQAPTDFQRTSVGSLVVSEGITTTSPITPSAIDNTGSIDVTTTWASADQPTLASFCRRFALMPSAAQKAAAQVLALVITLKGA